MQKTLDQTLSFRDDNKREGKCRLRVWQEPGQVSVVLFTELEDNPGSSITNAIERVACEAFKLLERPESGVVTIEHYRDRGLVRGKPMYKEEFDIVMFTQTASNFDDPCWRRISREEVERIIGNILIE